MSVEERLGEIRDRLEKATEGEWNTDLAARNGGRGTLWDVDGASIWSEFGYFNIVEGGRDANNRAIGVIRNEDADFIANAKADIEFLLGLIDEQKGMSPLQEGRIT